MHHPRLRQTTPLAALAVLACIAGCADGGRKDAYRLDPTPNMGRLADTIDEQKNDEAVMWDTNFRQINEDGARFWLTDRPSRLNPRNIPY